MVSVKEKAFFLVVLLFIVVLSFFVSAEVIEDDGVNYVSINVSNRWNLISGISFNENDIHKTSKVNLFGLWRANYWDAENQSLVEIRPTYSIVGEVDPLKFYSSAFWVFSAVPGKLIYRASPSFIDKERAGGYYEFFKGDNVIAINDEMYGMSVNEIKGDCDVLNASYWDAEKQDWVLLGASDGLDFVSRELLVGHGINVKVSEDCKFFSGEINPESGFNVSVATLKNNYLVGEVIGLTDPPSENIAEEESIESVGSSSKVQSNKIGKIMNDPDLMRFDYERPQFNSKKVIVKFRRDVNLRTKGFWGRGIAGIAGLVGMDSSYLETDFDSLNEDMEENKASGFDNLLKDNSNSGNSIGDVYIIEVDNALKAVSDLRKNREVEYAEPNYVAYAFYKPNDEMYNVQWSFEKTMAESGWDIETGDSNITIAIIDTGVSYDHEDLSSNMLGDCRDGCPEGTGFDFVDIDFENDWEPDGYFLIEGEDYFDVDNGMSDYGGHGTHCAGISSGVTNNEIGIAGVCHGCKIMPVKAGFAINSTYGEESYFEYDDIVNSIIYAVDNGADVISMSFGAYYDSTVVRDAINYAHENGVILVAAAGNEDWDRLSFPASYDNVISVASTDATEGKSFFSNYGYSIDVAAPGSSILSTVPYEGLISDLSGYKRISGTSMSAPFVAGLAGLILSKDPKLNNEEVRKILKSTTDFPNSDVYIGSGRVNVKKALEMEGLPLFVKINSPEVGDVLRGSVKVVSSVIDGEYILYYGNGVYPSEWVEIESGVSSDGGLSVMWNTKDLFDGVYSLRMLVSGEEGVSEDIVTVEIGNDYKEGWPVILEGASEALRYQVSIGDIDGDLKHEVVASVGNLLYVWREDGSLVEGWPKDLVYELKQIPVLGDIDGDLEDEIIVSASGRVFAFDGDGSPVSGWPVKTYSSSMYPPVLNDIDRDGDLEVIVAGANYDCSGEGCRIYVFESDGQLVPNWPQTTSIYAYSSPAVGDLDGDGNNEIVVSGPNWADYGEGGLPYLLYVFNSVGDVMWTWESNNGSISSYPVIADVNNDGFNEIVVNGYKPTDEFGHGVNNIRIFNSEGEIIEDFDVNGTDYSPISVANVDSDPELEIIPSPDASSINYFSNYEIWNSDGTLFNRFDIYMSGNNLFKGGTSVGDLNSDGESDFVIASNSRVFAFDTNGVSLGGGWPKDVSVRSPGAGSARRYFPVIADLDGDQRVEIILGMEDRVFNWELDGFYDDSNVEWPMYAHNRYNTGCYNCDSGEIESERPQSKVVNEGSSELIGQLTIKIVRLENDEWVNIETVIDETVIIPGNGLLKLDNGEDNLGNQVFEGFNRQGVSMEKKGDYRVLVSFEGISGAKKESSWGFRVAEENLEVVCGDSVCNGDEDCGTCKLDCGACPVCGDLECNEDENCDTCEFDCGECSTCGDGKCDGDENCGTCIGDCGACPVCGDGECNEDKICLACENVNLVTNGGGELGDDTGWTGVQEVISFDKRSGAYSFKQTNFIEVVYSNELIEVDSEKTYVQEGFFKANGTSDSRLFFGFMPFDENKNRITVQSVTYYENSETELYSDIIATDKIIKITDGTNWRTLEYAIIAFNVDDSGEYSDLPNYETSSGRGINRVENMGDFWEIELDNPVGRTYSAGTKIREHMYGGTYMYASANNLLVPNEWTRYSTTMKGVGTDSNYRSGKWWPGTKYVRTMLLPNYYGDSNSELLFDDVSLRLCEPETCVDVVCGDSVCNGDENCGTCKSDCGACPVCGDLECNGDETCETCEFDCGICVVCGDDICSEGEGPSNCAEDCSLEFSNWKRMDLYNDKEVFLVSDSDWHNVLPLVSMTTWTQQKGDNVDCNRVYDGGVSVCAYPTLIWHEEEYQFNDNSRLLERYEDGFSDQYATNSEGIIYNNNDLSKVYFYNISTEIPEEIFSYNGFIRSLFANEKYVVSHIYDREVGEVIYVYDLASESLDVVDLPGNHGGYSIAVNEEEILISKGNYYDEFINYSLMSFEDYSLDFLVKGAGDFAEPCAFYDENMFACFFYDGESSESILQVYNSSSDVMEVALTTPENVFSRGKFVDNNSFYFGTNGGIFEYKVREGKLRHIIQDAELLDSNSEGILFVNFRTDGVYFYNINTGEIVLKSEPGIKVYGGGRFVGESVFVKSYNEGWEYYLYGKDNFIEVSAYDADGIVQFMQDYNSESAVIVGSSSSEINNLLIAEKDFGVGLDVSEIRSIEVENYLSYWEEFNDIVYVEDNYSLALVASTYASLINAPLIIAGGSVDDDDIFTNRNVVCVGSVNRDCDESYDIKELQIRYKDLTFSNKIMLVNPNDLDMSVKSNYQSEKGAYKITEAYGKQSLASPFLASAKYEVVVEVFEGSDYMVVDEDVSSQLDEIGLGITGETCLLGDDCSEGFIAESNNYYVVEESFRFNMSEEIVNNESIYGYVTGFFYDCESGDVLVGFYNNGRLVQEEKKSCREILSKERETISFAFEDVSLDAGVVEIRFSGAKLLVLESASLLMAFYADRGAAELECYIGESCDLNSLSNLETFENHIAEDVTAFYSPNYEVSIMSVEVFSYGIWGVNVSVNGEHKGKIQYPSPHDGSYLNIEGPILPGSKVEIIPLFYDNENFYGEYIANVNFVPYSNKYLTIFASHLGIVDSIGSYRRDTIDWKYGSKSNSVPETPTGRIIGLTTSDVSSYVARSLFYDVLFDNIYSEDDFNGIAVSHSRVQYARDSEKVFDYLEDLGYEAECHTDEESEICDSNIRPEHENFAHKQIMTFADHGNDQGWAGTLSTKTLPSLDLAFTISKACSPSDIPAGGAGTFGPNVLRRGGIANSGGSGVTPALPGVCSENENRDCWEDSTCKDEGVGNCISKLLPGSGSLKYISENPEMTLGELYMKLSLDQWLSGENSFVYFDKHLFLGDPTLRPRWKNE
jgi:subtilisin family serine protease